MTFMQVLKTWMRTMDREAWVLVGVMLGLGIAWLLIITVW